MTRRRGFALGLALFVLLLAWVGVRGLLARDHLLKARSEVSQLQSAIAAGHLEGLDARVAEIRHEAHAAQALTSDPVWEALGGLPWLGSTLDAAHKVALSVNQVASQVLPPLVRASDTIQPGTLRSPDGTLKLSRLPAATPDLRTSSAALTSALGRLRAAPTSGVISPITKAQATLTHSLDGLAGSLDTATRAAEIGPAMAGANGPRRYLVIFQTPAEARGTGGLAGSYAIIEFDHGKLTTERSGSDTDFKQATSPVVNLGADFNSRYAQIDSAESWGNANFTPNFPWAAAIWAGLWQRQSGERVDGVIAVDPIALGYLLSVTGPVTLSDDEVISSANAARWSMSDAYRIYANNPVLRKQLGVELSKLTLSRLSSSSTDLTSLLTVMGRAAGEHRLQVWSAHPAEQQVIEGTPASGELPDAAGPFADLVLLNGGGDKLDYYLGRSLDYHVMSCTPKQRAVRISFTLTNAAPRAGLPLEVTIRNDHRIVPVGQSRVFADLFMARGAVLKSWTLNGKRIPARLSEERGHSVAEFDIELPPGQSRTVTANITEPPSKRPVVIPIQPLARPLAVTSGGHC